MPDDHNDPVYIDPAHTAHLCDDGSPGYAAIVAIDSDGRQHLILAHCPSVNTSATFDAACYDATHEQTGPLPPAWMRRLTVATRNPRITRCGHPTKAGRPCRIRVSTPGTPCDRHRAKVTDR